MLFFKLFIHHHSLSLMAIISPSFFIRNALTYLFLFHCFDHFAYLLPFSNFFFLFSTFRSFLISSSALKFILFPALDEFKQTADGLDSESLSASLGVPKEIIDTLGISDLASIFTNPPPGIDEIVALTKIFQYADEKGMLVFHFSVMLTV